QQQDALAQPITPEEVSNTIKTLQKGKAPGPDGFANSYYSKFRKVLASRLAEVFNEALQAESLLEEMQLAHIITLPKPDKPPWCPQNFRPISLLSTDAKLVAKLYALRLGPILPHIIHDDQ
ncbi:Hypothetical predicted protein, partial [Pelobates cultripes]